MLLPPTPPPQPESLPRSQNLFHCSAGVGAVWARGEGPGAKAATQCAFPGTHHSTTLFDPAEQPMTVGPKSAQRAESRRLHAGAEHENDATDCVLCFGV